MSLLPPGTTGWILTDGKAGLKTHCTGLAEALGLKAQERVIAPRRLWSALMPYGPVDPREAPDRPGSPIAAPFPDILIASGRRTLAYLREVRKRSQRATFTIYMQDPAIGRAIADVICVPQHDSLRGDNVLTSLTSPHGLTPAVLAGARALGDERLTGLAHPRLAMVLGGNSAHFDFSPADAERLAAIALHHLREGHSLMVTPSRRTPAHVTQTMRTALESSGFASSSWFVWDHTGSNPYFAMLALADAILVTGDSVNMVGEATATGRPVHIFLPSGTGHVKISRFHQGLYEAGVARPYQGKIDTYTYEPLDATPALAQEVARRYRAFKLAAPV